MTYKSILIAFILTLLVSCNKEDISLPFEDYFHYLKKKCNIDNDDKWPAYEFDAIVEYSTYEGEPKRELLPIQFRFRRDDGKYSIILWYKVGSVSMSSGLSGPLERIKFNTNERMYNGGVEYIDGRVKGYFVDPYEFNFEIKQTGNFLDGVAVTKIQPAIKAQ